MSDDGERIAIFPAFKDYLQSARFKVAYGGRGSAKTRTFCTILTNNVLHSGWKVVGFREIMESIADSVYSEFVAEIDRRNLHPWFDIQKTEIKCKINKGIIKFSGLKSSAKRLDSQKLKGFSDFDAAWLEEAESVQEDSWNALIPTMRKANSEIWVSFNPSDPLADTYKRFVTECRYPEFKDGKRYAIIKKINYTDNPKFPKELRDDMELMKENDFQLYRHVYLGEPVANSELSIIKPHWIEAAKDAHIKLGIASHGGRIAGFDVADEGPDCNALIWRQGIILDGLEEWRDQDPVSAAQHAHMRCLENRIELLRYDNIGVGAGAKGEFRQEQQRQLDNLQRGFQRVQTEGFNAAGAVMNPDAMYMPGKTNKDMFANIKAQAWWLLADRFMNTWRAVDGKSYDVDKLISLPSNIAKIDKLCAELAQPRREYINGKVRVESKTDMKKRGVASPNLADACVMAYLENTGFDLRALL